MKRLLCMILTGLLLISSAACITRKPMPDPEQPAAVGTLEPIELPSAWPEEPLKTDESTPDDSPRRSRSTRRKSTCPRSMAMRTLRIP